MSKRIGGRWRGEWVWMIVIEREYMAKIIRALKAAMNSDDQGYRTGYIVALSTVEGVMAVAPEYDLDRLKLPGEGTFTPRTVERILDDNPPKDVRFMDGHCKWFTPSEVRQLLEKDSEGRL